jgi:predicted membrane GTPase involved in stress response
MLLALHVPADPAQPVSVVSVPDTAPGISHAIGGLLLDEPLTGHLGRNRYSLYLAEDRTRLPDNPRAAAVLARLGLERREVMAAARGNLLVTGLHPATTQDTDIDQRLLDTLTRAHPDLRPGGPTTPQ